MRVLRRKKKEYVINPGFSEKIVCVQRKANGCVETPGKLRPLQEWQESNVCT